VTASVAVIRCGVAVPTPDAAITTKETDSTAKFDRLTVHASPPGLWLFPDAVQGVSLSKSVISSEHCAIWPRICFRNCGSNRSYGTPSSRDGGFAIKPIANDLHDGGILGSAARRHRTVAAIAATDSVG